MKKGDITLEKASDGYYWKLSEVEDDDFLLLTRKELKDIYYLIGKILKK